MDAKVPPYTHTQADTYLTPSHTTLEGQAHRDRKGMRRPSVGHGNTLILHLYHPPTIPQPQKELHPSARTICTHARRFIAMQRCISVHWLFMRNKLSTPRPLTVEPITQVFVCVCVCIIFLATISSAAILPHPADCRLWFWVKKLSAGAPIWLSMAAAKHAPGRNHRNSSVCRSSTLQALTLETIGKKYYPTPPSCSFASIPHPPGG